MSTYAIAHGDLFENSLEITFVEANSWQEALEQLPEFAWALSPDEDSLEEVKRRAFKGDQLLAIEECP